MDEKQISSEYYLPATNKPQSRIKNFFRWIGIIPGYIIAVVISFYLAKIFLSFPWWVLGVNSEAPIFKIMEILASGFSGYAAVYAGAIIAPYRKEFIAYILVALSILIGGMMLMLNLLQQQHYEAVTCVAVSIGSIILAIQVHSGEADLYEL